MLQHSPQEKIFKMTYGDPKVHFLDQFFMLIPNMASVFAVDIAFTTNKWLQIGIFLRVFVRSYYGCI